ncbi:MAG: hypothetical protein HFF58_07175 [Lawsonibacter sp.]|nr:hypothetical protein [Lawsonibacter sp.]
MTYFEKLLLNYLRDSKVKMEITGLDLNGFQDALREESKHRLELIEQIIFEDSEIISDMRKVEAIKKLFQQEFYSKD